MTKVSIVIPSFNSQKTIIEAIESVLTQTYTDFEIIFVDDGSTDQSVDILQSIKDPAFIGLRKITRAVQQRVTKESVLRLANCFVFLDADDIWVSNKLEKQLIDIQSAQMAFSNIKELIDPSIQYGAPPRVMPGYYASTMMILRSDFLKVGLFDESLAVAEFIDWLSRAKDSGLSMHLNPEILAFRRIHQGNVGRLNKPNSHHYAIALKAAIDRKRKQAK